MRASRDERMKFLYLLTPLVLSFSVLNANMLRGCLFQLLSTECVDIRRLLFTTRTCIAFSYGHLFWFCNIHWQKPIEKSLSCTTSTFKTALPLHIFHRKELQHCLPYLICTQGKLASRLISWMSYQNVCNFKGSWAKERACRSWSFYQGQQKWFTSETGTMSFWTRWV